MIINRPTVSQKVDLSKLDNKAIDESLFEAGKNEFTYTLPTLKNQ